MLVNQFFTMSEIFPSQCHILNFEFIVWVLIQNLQYDKLSYGKFCIHIQPVNSKFTIWQQEKKNKASE